MIEEVPLASELGTSRSAVCEAIRRLGQEGRVEHQMHRGAVVRVVSLADRLDVHGARAIETAAVRELLHRGAPVAVPLRDALEALR